MGKREDFAEEIQGSQGGMAGVAFVKWERTAKQIDSNRSGEIKLRNGKISLRLCSVGLRIFNFGIYLVTLTMFGGELDVVIFLKYISNHF